MNTSHYIYKASAACILALCLAGTARAQEAWSLRRCIDHAIEHNISIRQTANAAEQSKVEANTAKWARLPNLNGSAGQNWSWGRSQTAVADEETGEYNTMYVNTKTHGTNFGLSAGMPLFTGLQLPNQYALAKLNLKAAMADLEKAKDDATRNECARFYLAHTEALNNWDLVDLSCYKILGPWLTDRSVLYEWAHSGHLWLQRVAIVTCMHPVRHGDFADAFAIADILLNHPHDLIHKAVGWILREAGKRDEAALTAYLIPRYRHMPRTMLRYAIERFKESKRQQFLQSKI